MILQMSAEKMWFTLQDSKPIGPFSSSEILLRLQSKMLGEMDLISSRSDKNWKYIFAVSEFFPPRESEVLAASLAELESILPWVVLRADPARADRFVQDGPLSSEQINVRLRRRDILFTDYVWRSGFRHWTSIRHVPDFRWVREDMIHLQEYLPTSRVFVPDLAVPSAECAVQNIFCVTRKSVPSSIFDVDPNYKPLCG